MFSLFQLSSLLLAIKVSAQSQHCSDEGVCIALSIPYGPGTTAKNADILATIRAPQSAGWFGLGFGQGGMVGSFMLVTWPYNSKTIITTRVAKSACPDSF
jgi:hypothetical protein